MALETVINDLANSIHLDGRLAEEIKRALSHDVPEELDHAQKLAERLKHLGGRIPGSFELKFDQETLRPPSDTTEIKAVINGVVEAEAAAINHYRSIIRRADDNQDDVSFFGQLSAPVETVAAISGAACSCGQRGSAPTRSWNSLLKPAAFSTSALRFRKSSCREIMMCRFSGLWNGSPIQIGITENISPQS